MAAPAVRTARRGTTAGTRRRPPGPNAALYWMVVPAAVLFFVFHTLPVLQGVFYSLTDSPGYGDWTFVGLSNYVALV